MSSYKNELTEEERKLIYKINCDSILGYSYRGPQEIWQKRQAQLEADRLQPYADILYDQILSELDTDSIIAALNEKAASATHKRELHVPIWSYNSVSWLKEIGEIIMEGGSPRALREKIESDGTDWTLSTTDSEGVPNLWPVRVDRIMRKSDILQRLAAAFGVCFSITQPSTLLREMSTEHYHTRKVTLQLNYFPGGLEGNRLRQMLAVVRKYETYNPAPLAKGSVIRLWKGDGPKNPGLEYPGDAEHEDYDDQCSCCGEYK